MLKTCFQIADVPCRGRKNAQMSLFTFMGIFLKFWEHINLRGLFMHNYFVCEAWGLKYVEPVGIFATNSFLFMAIFLDHILLSFFSTKIKMDVEWIGWNILETTEAI